MDVDQTFNVKLAYGNTFEEQTLKEIKTQLPDFQSFITNQEPGSEDRIDYFTADIVVINPLEIVGSKPSFACECKLNTEYFRKCKEFNGWDPENNVPINLKSFKRYYQADFPLYIISHQYFKDYNIDYYRFYPISKIIKGPRPQKLDFRGVTKLNFNATNWYKADTLQEVIRIIKQELYEED